MGKPDPPKAPDPVQTISAQSQANSQSALQTAELNRINQYTPYGSLTYDTNGTYSDGTPKYSQTTTLAPAQQNLLNLANQGAQTLGQTGVGMLGQVQNSYAKPIDYSGAPGIASNVAGAGTAQQIGNGALPQLSGQINSQGNITGNISNSGPGIVGQIPGQGNTNWAIAQAENAAYQKQAQYLDPQYRQMQGQLDNSLINQGITQGSEAYRNAQNNLALQRQQAYGNAGLQAVQAGQNEQNTLFGQGLQAGQFQNAANAQGFNQGLSAAQLQNAAQQQSFGQGLQSTNLANDVAQQGYGNILALNAQNNAAQAQNYGQNLSSAQLQNQAQAQYLQQLFAQRNQPLNEYNALASGSQVSQPNFSQYAQSPVATTNAAGIINQGYQNQLGAYQQQMAGYNNLLGLGGQLGAAAFLA